MESLSFGDFAVYRLFAGFRFVRFWFLLTVADQHLCIRVKTVWIVFIGAARRPARWEDPIFMVDQFLRQVSHLLFGLGMSVRLNRHQYISRREGSAQLITAEIDLIRSGKD